MNQMKLDNSFKERKSLGHDVFEYLKNAIIDQTIEPGSRLVESKIADMLGISRTPLREALHKPTSKCLTPLKIAMAKRLSNLYANTLSKGRTRF